MDVFFAEFFASLGVLRALIALTAFILADNAVALSWAFIVLLIIVFYASFGAFLRAFKIINRKQPPSLSPAYPSIRPYQWAVLTVPAGIFALQLYLRHQVGLPITSPILSTLAILLLILAIPYYGYTLYKMLRS